MWLCRACELKEEGKPPPQCCLCPIAGGALKPTTIPGLWAHAACMQWIPEVRSASQQQERRLDDGNSTDACCCSGASEVEQLKGQTAAWHSPTAWLANPMAVSALCMHD